jgi:drug/metabolite transporter (DMT)-like permease
MNWLPIALACAFFTACCDAVSKRIMLEADEWLTGTILLAWAVAALFPLFLWLNVRLFTWEVGGLLAIVLPLEVFSYYLFLSAIRRGELSLTVPLLAFTPVLTIASSAALLDERISQSGAAGIALVTGGAYLLNGDLMHQTLFAPVRALFTNPGSQRMLAVACIWSITSALGKKGVLLYDPIPFGFAVLAGDLVFFALITLSRFRTGRMRSGPKKGLWIFFAAGGLLMAGAEITHVVALSMAPVAYMIAVKRLSLVFSVILGRIFFGENVRYRVIGAAVMVAGVYFLYP